MRALRGGFIRIDQNTSCNVPSYQKIINERRMAQREKVHDRRSTFAERVGFEPTIPLPVYHLSRVASSTAPAPLHLQVSIFYSSRISLRPSSEVASSPPEADQPSAEIRPRTTSSAMLSYPPFLHLIRHAWKTAILLGGLTDWRVDHHPPAKRRRTGCPLLG
jgi:hypothetical protein